MLEFYSLNILIFICVVTHCYTAVLRRDCVGSSNLPVYSPWLPVCLSSLINSCDWVHFHLLCLITGIGDANREHLFKSVLSQFSVGEVKGVDYSAIINVQCCGPVIIYTCIIKKMLR